MFAILFALIATSVAGCMTGGSIGQPDVSFVFLADADDEPCDYDKSVCDMFADDPRRK